jgi:hypothetical protein
LKRIVVATAAALVMLSLVSSAPAAIKISRISDEHVDGLLGSLLADDGIDEHGRVVSYAGVTLG